MRKALAHILCLVGGRLSTPWRVMERKQWIRTNSHDCHLSQRRRMNYCFPHSDFQRFDLKATFAFGDC